MDSVQAHNRNYFSDFYERDDNYHNDSERRHGQDNSRFSQFEDDSSKRLNRMSKIQSELDANRQGEGRSKTD